MPTGTVKFFNRKKGYGFIITEEAEKEIFFHATTVVDKNNLNENDKVSYEEQEGERGLHAINVQKV